ncbi:MAG TPA: hypothetical protein PK767_05450 [Clostridiales bacterium]|nr:hypothetical protein [Clostridiales bacterium]HOL92265.1 hypothetical protein [Clostridiales bacterium]HPP35674.1 hypothetical protein [Clostridiales bacterium]
MSSDIPVKEIGELLDAVSDKAPKIITSLMDTLYSAESAKKMGQAVGSFYRELVESGIPQEEALKLARDYMLSLKDMTGSFQNNAPDYNAAYKQADCSK